MSIIDIPTVIGFILEKAGDHLISVAQRKEAVIHILTQLNLGLDMPPPDFEGLYTYTLVEWGIGKPRNVLDLFRSEFIQEAFRKAFVKRDPALFRAEMANYL